MSSVLTVMTPRADEGRLVTLQAIKDELQIIGTDSDDYLNAALVRASEAVEQYCNRIFPVETLSETFRSDAYCGWTFASGCSLLLKRYPVVSITSVVVDGATVDPSEYEIVAEDGWTIYRLLSDTRTTWSGSKIVVIYSAGYTTIPGPVQQGIIELVKLNQAARTRDPALRSENILEGLYSYTLFNGDSLKSLLSGVAGLDRYIIRTVG